jgi:hypothetical protein
MRKAILVVRLAAFAFIGDDSKVHDQTRSNPLSIANPGWETYCHKVADLIIGEQSPTHVLEVRSKNYSAIAFLQLLFQRSTDERSRYRRGPHH